MNLNENCLSEYSDIRLLPINNINNESNIINHLLYKNDEINVISKFSILLREFLFSLNDFKYFLKYLIKNSFKFSNKFLSSIFIYFIGIILILMILSIVFYIISYSNLKQFKSIKIYKSSIINIKYLSLILLLIIYLFLFIQMIFLIENGNKTKIHLEKSIKLINEEFNSNTISEHFQNFLKQFNNYSTKCKVFFFFK